MKKVILKTAIATIMFAMPFIMFGQTITKQFETRPFTGISAGGVYTVSLTQDDEFSIVVETTEEQMEKVEINVRNNTLHIGYEDRVLRRVDRINVSVSAPVIEKIIASGDAAINGMNKFTSPKLEVIGSGASDIRLNLETEELKTSVSGAANVTLKGTATKHETNVSGASYLKAYELQTSTTIAGGSGASTIEVNASDRLDVNTSGTASVRYKQVPESHSFKTSGAGSISFKGDPAELEGTALQETHKKDTVRVSVRERDLLIITDEQGRKERVVKRRRTFRNNWSGIEMGINGYLTPDHSINLPDDHFYMEPDYTRSLSVNLNLYQQNFNIIRNNVGLFTGFGFGFINYAFDNDITLLHEKDGIDYVEEDHGFRRNRLSLVNFNVPLMLEFQTSSRRTVEQFHLAAGVIGTAKLRSYTKQVYDFEGDRQRDEMRKSYHTRPFNLDATVRIGWGRVNLFANYSLFTLFRDDKGPELHPFNVGVRLVSW